MNVFHMILNRVKSRWLVMRDLYELFVLNRKYFKKERFFYYLLFKIMSLVQIRFSYLCFATKYRQLTKYYIYPASETDNYKILWDSLSYTKIEKVCIYAYYSPKECDIEPNIVVALQYLKKRDYKVIFVSTSMLSKTNVEQLSAECSVVVSRPNICADMGSYKTAFRILSKKKIVPDLTALLIMNSSVVVDENSFDDLLTYCECSSADFVGQTQNTEIALHVQSYFIYFSHCCLQDVNLFFSDFALKSFCSLTEGRKYIVERGEVALSQYLLSRGKVFTTFIELSALNILSYDFVKKYHPPLVKKKILYLDRRNVLRRSYFLDVTLQYEWLQKGGTAQSLGCILSQKINLFSIVYDERSVRKDCQILKLCNLENPKPPLREYYIFQTMYDYLIAHINSSEEGEYYWGFLSWKFKEKVRYDESIFLHALHAYPEYDAYFINPFEKVLRRHKNIFHQGEVFHPGITELTRAVLKKAGYSFDITQLVFSSDRQAFCNYFVGNKKFWDCYIQFMSPIVYVMETCFENEFPLLFKRADEKIDANYMSFIIERLFSVFLHTETSLRIKKVIK